MVFNFHPENEGYSHRGSSEPIADYQEILANEARAAYETGETEAESVPPRQTPEPEQPQQPEADRETINPLADTNIMPWWFGGDEDDDMGGPSSG